MEYTVSYSSAQFCCCSPPPYGIFVFLGEVERTAHTQDLLEAWVQSLRIDELTGG